MKDEMGGRGSCRAGDSFNRDACGARHKLKEKGKRKKVEDFSNNLLANHQPPTTTPSTSATPFACGSLRATHSPNAQ